ncbi:MAG: hypothetical protein JRE64_16785 [Deltaproteobacteria bacterium]|nr:hypothetical protein [Deltaproteobacteria bacterium]
MFAKEVSDSKESDAEKKCDTKKKKGKKKSKSSGKERATDRPDWAKGEKPKPGESGMDFAKRLLDNKYGKDSYKKGPGSEFNKLKKFGDRFNK